MGVCSNYHGFFFSVTLTRFVPKCPKFCLIVNVIIFLEKNRWILENLYPMVLDHALSETMFTFSYHAPFFKYGKRKKILILIQWFLFFIRNPLMDRSSHLDLVA